MPPTALPPFYYHHHSALLLLSTWVSPSLIDGLLLWSVAGSHACHCRRPWHEATRLEHKHGCISPCHGPHLCCNGTAHKQSKQVKLSTRCKQGRWGNIITLMFQRWKMKIQGVSLVTECCSLSVCILTDFWYERNSLTDLSSISSVCLHCCPSSFRVSLWALLYSSFQSVHLSPQPPTTFCLSDLFSQSYLCVSLLSYLSVLLLSHLRCGHS